MSTGSYDYTGHRPGDGEGHAPLWTTLALWLVLAAALSVAVVAHG